MLEVLLLQAEPSRGAVETWFVTPSGDARALGDAEDHSMCHGVMGTIDVLLESAVRWPSGPWLARAQQASMLAVDSASGSWRSGAPGAVETPGLLMGLAGIGYELLRIANPGRVPSVLTLDSLDSGARS
jgi:lantibiotic modifying enzyme